MLHSERLVSALSGAALACAATACCSNPECTPVTGLPDVPTSAVTTAPTFEGRVAAVLTQSHGLGPAPRPEFLVDIHTHTFNANYLPLPEIVRARVCNGGLRYLARAVVRTLQLATEPPYGDTDAELRIAEQAGPDGVEQRLDWLLGTDEEAFALADSKALEECRDYICGRADRDDSGARMSWNALRQDPRYLEGVEFLGMTHPASHAVDHREVEAAVAASSWLQELRSIIPFIGGLGTKDEEMPQRYRAAFGLDDGGPFPKKVLMATQQGDFGPAYGGRGLDKSASGLRRRRYRDYRTVLLPASGALQAREDQDLLLFGSYCPFTGDDARAGIELAYDAVVEHGAIGLKYYPPSGSSATGNPAPARPARKHQRKAWESRYVEDGKTLTDKALDDRVAEFLDWCIASDLPVFTHSNPGEFEAFPCYGYTFPHPVHWMRFIESDPGRHKLRLCLGHASGPDYWFGSGEERPTDDWGPIAAYLAMTYDNVYIELGVHDAIVDKDRRAHFVAVLESLEELGEERGFPHSISDKVMYGTDWFMPYKDASPTEYLDGYVQALAQLDMRAGGGNRWTENFFWRNALRYINAEGRRSTGLVVAPLSEERPGRTVTLPAAVADDLAAFPGN